MINAIFFFLIKSWVLCYFKKDYCNCPLSKDPLNLKKKKFCFNNLNYTIYPELNFRSRILKSEISITVTKASKLRSFGRLYSHNFHNFPHHFHHCLPHPSHYFLNNIFSSFLYSKKSAKNQKKIILGRSIGTTMQKV